jgi:two-component system cell cycle sensor histidine kinase/response regulator CckA
VAHDLNNLLVPMLAYSDLALRALPARDPLREHISEIHEAAKRASELVRQLLAFGRRQILSPQQFDLGAELRALEPMLRRLVGPATTLTLRTDAEPSVVLADLSQLERILVNLAINAIDAMPDSGALTIATQNIVVGEEIAELRPGAYVVIQVADNGTGMDAQTLARIFEPFFTTKKRHGTGLGLPTVYGLTKQHAGHITVRSELGHGTTFEVFLPRVQNALAPALGRDRTSDAPRTAADTVLVVDDDPKVLHVLESMIVQLGHRAMSSSDPEQAVRIARELGDRLAVLVTDVRMPVMNGRELYERIARDHPTLRVLFVSGFAADVIGVEGVLERGFELMQKPFSMEALRVQLNKLAPAR